jgi:type IV pilus assembly protein PilP
MLNKVDVARVPEFLEGFTLDSLYMVGTIHRQGELWALVKIPSGGIQRLKKGNYIGKNFGLIKEITTSKIKIKEIVPNGFGGYKPRENAISLVDAD